MSKKNLPEYFSKNYAQARKAFIDAAIKAGYQGEYYQNPYGMGPNNESLCTDVARIGPDDAQKILIVSSGVHGTEGYAGSAIQCHAIETGLLSQRPENMAIVLVHAMNPYGFAYNHRANENNVDLNRNAIDWSAAPPKEHPLNAEIQKMLLPDQWHWPIDRVTDFVRHHGMSVAKNALLQGQYATPDGLFYGGRKEEWSTSIWRDILTSHIRPETRHVAHVDIHTGLGSSGDATMIVRAPPGSPMTERAHDWWINAVITLDAPPALTGPMNSAFNRVSRNVTVTTVTLEIGTYDMMHIIEALALDNWVRAKNRQKDSIGDEARAKVIEALCPADPAWKRKTIERGADMLQRARWGLERS